MKSVIFWFWIQCSRVLLSNYENCTNTNYHKQVSAIPKLFRHQNSFANNDRILPRLTQLLQINFLIVLLLNQIEKFKPIIIVVYLCQPVSKVCSPCITE